MVVIEGNDPSCEPYESPAYPSMLYHHKQQNRFCGFNYKLNAFIFAVTILKLVAEEVFETSNPAYEAFIYPDSPR